MNDSSLEKKKKKHCPAQIPVTNNGSPLCCNVRGWGNSAMSSDLGGQWRGDGISFRSAALPLVGIFLERCSDAWTSAIPGFEFPVSLFEKKRLPSVYFNHAFPASDLHWQLCLKSNVYSREKSIGSKLNGETGSWVWQVCMSLLGKSFKQPYPSLLSGTMVLCLCTCSRKRMGRKMCLAGFNAVHWMLSGENALAEKVQSSSSLLTAKSVRAKTHNSPQFLDQLPF